MIEANTPSGQNTIALCSKCAERALFVLGEIKRFEQGNGSASSEADLPDLLKPFHKSLASFHEMESFKVLLRSAVQSNKDTRVILQRPGRPKRSLGHVPDDKKFFDLLRAAIQGVRQFEFIMCDRCAEFNDSQPALQVPLRPAEALKDCSALGIPEEYELCRGCAYYCLVFWCTVQLKKTPSEVAALIAEGNLPANFFSAFNRHQNNLYDKANRKTYQDFKALPESVRECVTTIGRLLQNDPTFGQNFVRAGEIVLAAIEEERGREEQDAAQSAAAQQRTTARVREVRVFGAKFALPFSGSLGEVLAMADPGHQVTPTEIRRIDEIMGNNNVEATRLAVQAALRQQSVALQSDHSARRMRHGGSKRDGAAAQTSEAPTSPKRRKKG